MRSSPRLLARALPLVIAGGLAVSWLDGQEPPVFTPFTDRSEVSAVLVAVTVKDSHGAPVATLKRDKFRLFVDDIEFPIRSFAREAVLPLSLAFVLDISGSMEGRRLHRADEVILEFLRQRGRDDEFSLITFGADEVARRLPFGTDPSLLPRILESLHGFGTTALYDTLTATPQIMRGARNPRRAVLLMTDGVDTASKVSPAEAQNVLEGMQDPLYAFGIEPPPPEPGQETYESLLSRLAEASGGRYIKVGDVAELPLLGRELRRELATRYIITFEPSGVGTVKWRRLRVVVEGPYKVIAREGYRGTLP